MPDKPELTPCATNHRLFLSTDLGDHAEAREDCYSCPRIAWCADERAAAAADNGRTSVDGTWAGILWVDGVISDTGKRMYKAHPRPRPVVA